MIDGKAVELICYTCKATAGLKNMYFAGAAGSSKHIQMHPSEIAMKLHDITEKAVCSGCLQKVSKEDVLRITRNVKPMAVKEPFSGNEMHNHSDAHLDNSHVEPSIQTIGKGPKRYAKLDAKHYPCIIFLDNTWSEVWCHKCGGNTMNDSRSFFNGIQGLTAHVGQCTSKPIGCGSNRLSFDEVAGVCGKPVLSTEDVQQIPKGKKPTTEIVKRINFKAMLEGAKKASKPAQWCDLSYREGSTGSDMQSSWAPSSPQGPSVVKGKRHGHQATPGRYSEPPRERSQSSQVQNERLRRELRGE